MKPVQNVAITGWERVGSPAWVSPHKFVLSGLPLVSFSSLIMLELSWGKRKKENPLLGTHKKKKSSTDHGQELDGSSIFRQTRRTQRTVRGMEGSRWGEEGRGRAEKDEAVQCCVSGSLYKQTGLLSVAVPATVAPLWGSRLTSVWIRRRLPIRQFRPAEFWIQPDSTVFTKPLPL